MAEADSDAVHLHRRRTDHGRTRAITVDLKDLAVRRSLQVRDVQAALGLDHLLLGLAHHKTISRYYAHELACLRDPLRFKDGAPCPNDYLNTPQVCRRCALKRRGDPAAGGDVVVLDQDSVIQAEAVVHPAAAAHRVFLQGAQPRGGFARAGDPGARALDRAHMGGRQAGHAAQAPQ